MNAHTKWGRRYFCQPNIDFAEKTIDLEGATSGSDSPIKLQVRLPGYKFIHVYPNGASPNNNSVEVCINRRLHDIIELECLLQEKLRV